MLHGSMSWVRDWSEISSAAGAMVVTRKQAKEQGVQYAVCEKEAPKDLYATDNVKVVSVEWIIQSLINQRVVNGKFNVG